MRQLTTTFGAAAVAGLAGLAIAGATPVMGAAEHTPDKGSAKVEHRAGTEVRPIELRACLQSHGATGVPGDERQGLALKEWISTHQDEKMLRGALTACDAAFRVSESGGPAKRGAPDCAVAAGEKPSDGLTETRKGPFKRAHLRGVAPQP